LNTIWLRPAVTATEAAICSPASSHEPLPLKSIQASMKPLPETETSIAPCWPMMRG
jgi:hypothetical protein